MRDESTRAVLGALIFSPALLENSDLTAADFPAGHARETFQAIAEIWETTRSPEIPPAALRDNVQGNGAGTFLSSLYDGGIPRTPEAFALLASALRRDRQAAEIRALLDTLNREEVTMGIRDEEGFRRLYALIDASRRTERASFDIRKSFLTGSVLQDLEINTAWTVEKMIPERAITVIHSKGGLGKTWLALGLAKAVSEGVPFLGLQTKRKPVLYVDYENPLSLLIARTRLLDVRSVDFWHLSADVPPPRIDGPSFALFDQIPPGTLVIIDTLRAAHEGDENSSEDMAPVMNRFKTLRERGNDIIILHHVSKADDRTYKGSTAISDLADHVVSLHRVRRSNLQEIEDDAGLESDALFSLSTAKTRYERFRLIVTFEAVAGRFDTAQDPNIETLDAIQEYIAGPGSGQKQGDIIAWAKDVLGGGRRENYIALLRRGEIEGRWKSHRGFKGARLYEPPTSS